MEKGRLQILTTEISGRSLGDGERDGERAG